MFDIAPSEFLLTAIVAIVVIGPKDMPLALRTAGRWIGKMRRMSNHLRSGFEAMIREAELEEMEKKWREQNAAIMAAHPSTHLDAADPALPAPPYPADAEMRPLPAPATIEQPAIAQAAAQMAPQQVASEHAAGQQVVRQHAVGTAEDGRPLVAQPPLP